MCAFSKQALSIHRHLALGPELGVEITNKIGLCLHHHHPQVVHCRLTDQEIRDSKCTAVSVVMEGDIHRTDSWSGGLLKVSEPGDLGVKEKMDIPGQQSSEPPGSGWEMRELLTHRRTEHSLGFQINQRCDLWSICPGCGEW